MSNRISPPSTAGYIDYRSGSLLTPQLGTSGNIIIGSSNASAISTITVPAQYAFNSDLSQYKPEKVVINAGLYFRYVKKKFTKIQKAELESRLKKLLHLQLQAEITDQKGLLEQVESMLLVAAREQVLFVKKLDRFIMKTHIDKFLSKTQNVFLTTLDKFPRPIPADVQKKIKSVRELQVFDEFKIVYTDYTSQPVAKASADKIREKDPIIFGVMTGAPDRLYYIADWVDEFCDLTLDKLVERCKPEDNQELVKRLDELDIGELTRRVQNRLEALNQTTRENWRQQEKQAALEKSIIQKKSRFAWLKKLFS